MIKRHPATFLVNLSILSILTGPASPGVVLMGTKMINMFDEVAGRPLPGTDPKIIKMLKMTKNVAG
jgi:hypothetical protein